MWRKPSEVPLLKLPNAMQYTSKFQPLARARRREAPRPATAPARKLFLNVRWAASQRSEEVAPLVLNNWVILKHLQAGEHQLLLPAVPLSHPGNSKPAAQSCSL